ncbi:MAG: DUF362 domain-containing protein [Rikenellaceae bacterium]|nr:DUF362 domain-containing protein [Rikenellaceae bacterium]
MKKIFFIVIFMSVLTSTIGCKASETKKIKEGDLSETPVVYMTKDISPGSIIKMYELLGREAHGKVAIKLSMGEPGGDNYLKPELINDFVHKVNGTFIDANTAYGGKRASTEAHLQTARDHGFAAIAPVDILDAESEVDLPVSGGTHITRDIVGKNFLDYDFTVILSHFKGHAMGGFGGAIKNMSIGIASSNGKRLIHSGGASTTSWGSPSQEQFLETMAEAAKAIADHCGENIIYISVMNNLSVDCDCDSNPADPQMGDIGILASLYPVALDKACVDQVYASEDHGKIHLIERMESMKGVHTLVHAEKIGIGTQDYKLVIID